MLSVASHEILGARGFRAFQKAVVGFIALGGTKRTAAHANAAVAATMRMNARFIWLDTK